MYESPIDIIYSNIQTAFENEVFSSVQKAGINVDKHELIKALAYDRQQYEKGYADGKAEQLWVPVKDHLPKPNEIKNNCVVYYLVQNRWGDMMVATFRKNINGETFWQQMYTYKPVEDEIVAWQPLPKPY